MLHWPVWIGVVCEDIQVQRRFYRDVLGLTELPVRWYEEVLGLKRFYQTAWGDFPAVVGIGTTSLALFPVLTRRQIAFETQDHGIAHSIYVHDPSGHQIEITTYDMKDVSAAASA